MQIAKYRNIIVALLMMTFIGQVVASTTVPCQSQPAPLQSHEQMVDSGVMDHSQHMSLKASSVDAITALECCPDCDCSLGGCASAAVPTSQSAFASNLASSMSHYIELTESQLAVSLFRPPISR
jgi:hypothetical protein